MSLFTHHSQSYIFLNISFDFSESTSLRQQEDRGTRRDSDLLIALQHQTLWQSTPTRERFWPRTDFAEVKANVQRPPSSILKMSKKMIGQIGPSAHENVVEAIRSVSNPAILPIHVVSDPQRLHNELVTHNRVLEIGDVGQHGPRVIGTTRRDEAEFASHLEESEAENLLAQLVLQDQDLKRSIVTDGVRGRNGKEIAKAERTDLGSELVLASQRSVTDRTEKPDLATDQTRQCHQFQFPLPCPLTLLSELPFAGSSLVLLSALASSTTT